eukprot:CAMPEP_0167745776 /NCGR_PEP_ID=MMETSP0110_2-20121227/3341_1 /TAXON_ID=629695 /ORGANISM="Gymnochlora sp., Strain CCMP2014" /LENGTH=334 /DNA_ID=CAMNT_0007630459 /DNA_START=47 /DNA_END=1048 /DNA_ORIENTATION=+
MLALLWVVLLMFGGYRSDAQRFGFQNIQDIFKKPELDENGIIQNPEGGSPSNILSELGFMVDARFEELMEACVEGDLKLVKTILKERPHSINHRSVVMPLHAAVQHRRKKIVVWLIENGAFVDARTEDGSTAIALAAYNGDMELVKMLAERGSDPGIKNQQGYNALEVAQMQGYHEIHEYLTTSGRLQNAAMKGDLPTIKRMLKKKPWRVNEIRRFAPLHAAARFNHVELTKFLLNEGARVDIQMLDASTPLVLAAAEGHKEIVEILIANSADLNHVNYVGFDAYKAAIASGKHELAEFIDSYRDKSEDSDAEDDNEDVNPEVEVVASTAATDT